MKILKSVLTVILITVSASTINAQTIDTLIDKWQTTYEEAGESYVVTYEFRKDNNEIKVYSVLAKDGQGDTLKDNTLAMDEVRFLVDKGTAIYIVEDEGKTYNMKAKLWLKNSETLQIDYSYWGYSGTEIWKRVK